MSPKTTRFESLLEAVPDALVGMDQKGVIRFVNRQTELLFGYDRDTLIGEHIETLLPEPLWQIYASHRDEYFADPRTRSSGLDLELSGRHRDGREFPVNISMSHIDTGDVLLVITAVYEVARQKRAVKHAGLIEAVVESSEDAIIGTTLESVVTSWNPAAWRMYGYFSREMIGRSANILLPADRRDELLDNMARVKDGQTIHQYETTRVRRDGSTLPVSLTVAPIRDDEGTIIGASTVHRDVTRQQKAFEDAQRLAAIVEGSADAILGRTLDGTITSWNPAAERMYGYSADEIIGTSLNRLVPEDRMAETSTVMDRVAEGQHVERLETIRVRKDGTVFPVSITASPIWDAGGAITGASAIHRDVTEQRCAFEVAQRMEAIVENSEDAIISQSLDGIITSCNPAAERMYGYPAAEMVGKPISLLMPEDRKGEMDANLAKIRAGQHVEHVQSIRVRKDGTRFPISLSVSPIRSPDGEISGAAGIGRDLIEQEHAAHYARSLIEADMDPLVAISPEGKVNDINQAAVEMAGLPREAILGADFTQFVAEPENAAAYFQRVFEDGSVCDFPMTIPHTDGTTTDLRCNASVYRDINGNVLGVLAVGRDVTSQKEESTAHQRMEAIIESLDDAVIGRTLDGTITSWNPAAERIFGYTSAEIVGQHVDLLSPADRTGETISILAKISAGHAVENFETLRLRKDGTAITVSLTISPIRAPDGAVVGASMICRDVTELKHAAQYTRSLIEAALDPLVTISPAGAINDVNEAAVTVTGVPRHKLIGTDFSHYFTDPDKAHEAYQQAFTQGSVTGYPLTLRHRDGTLTEVLYNASVYRDTTGNVLGVLAVARDMSRQKEESAAAGRMAAIVEYSDDAVVGCTLDGIVTSWNPAAERMYGYPGEAIVRRSVDLLSPGDRAGEISSTLDRIRHGQQVDNLDTICLRKDRSAFPVKLTVAPIHDADGAVVGASAIARDVTEQREALATAQQMAAIVEGSDDAIFSRTLDGTVTSWNPAAERMYGYSGEEIIGRSIDLTIPEDRAGEAKAVVAKVSAGEQVEHLETVRARKDGTVFPVSITVSPIRDKNGSVIGASAIARDLTAPEHAAQYTRSLMEAALDPLVTISPEGRLNDVNEAMVKITGVSREGLIGTDFSDYFTEPDQAAEGSRQAFSQGSVTDCPLTLCHRDGTLTDVLFNASPYRDTTGNVLGLYAAAHRVPRHTQADETIEQ